MAARGTKQVGYKNRSDQVVFRTAELPGNDHNQLVYGLRCIPCGHEHGANGSDIFSAVAPHMTLVRQVCI